MPGPWLHDNKEGRPMLFLAYGFVACTGLMMLTLLWMAWAHNRSEAKIESAKKATAKISN